MAVRSALLSFPIAENAVDQLVSAVELVLRSLTDDFAVVSSTPVRDGRVVVFGSQTALLNAVMRIYSNNNLATLNLDEFVEGDRMVLLNYKVEAIKKKLSAICKVKVEKMPIIKRATKVPNYYTSSDDRILEYDFNQILFEDDSDFQHIKILSSPTLGNCLLLDDLQNLAEADIAYTQGLMKYGQISYKDKEILILGGGDGGLLHELLKESPKFVTMVDIDRVVVENCRKYLRGACGDSLDQLEGSNYRVLIGDCIHYMQDCINNRASFDVVFNDLTDIPICAGDSKAGELMKADDEEMWAFVRKILVLALQLIRDDGKYLNHAIGVGCVSALQQYEQLLSSLPVKVSFSKHTAYVPSFMEEWVFYDITKSQ